MIMVLLIKLLIISGCAELWYQGGGRRAWMRDILIPIILGGFTIWNLGFWWGFWTIASCQIIRMGYGVPDATDPGSFIGRIFKKAIIIRPVVAALRAFIGALFIVIATRQIIGYLLFCAIHSLYGFLEEKFHLHRKIGDRLAGASYAAMILIG